MARAGAGETGEEAKSRVNGKVWMKVIVAWGQS